MKLLIDRVAEKIDFTDDCWIWTACRDEKNYGRIGVNGKSKYAHRVLYELIVDQVSSGLELDHLCRNPPCVNPDHLEPVTHKINSLRGDVWKRKATHCPKDHPYDKKNTYILPSTGERKCRRCMADYKARKLRAAGVPERSKTHCKNGHSFEEYSFVRSDGHRRCKLCFDEYQIKYRENRRT